MTNNTNNPEELLDILGAIEVPQKKEEIIQKAQTTQIIEEPSNETVALKEKKEDILTNTPLAEKKKENTDSAKKLNRFLSASIFGVKYVVTSVFIFSVLLLTTNYSAYINIAKSYIYEDEIAQASQSLLNSVDAGEVVEEENGEPKKTKADRVNKLMAQEKNTSIKEDQFSIKKLVANLNQEDIDLGIKIVPYENRIIIPKIAQNIPLVDIKEVKVEGESQLNNIFMKELEDGVVRYPGSAKPGEIGNSFVFGHSSNFPWIAGEYNDVFARLGQVEPGDTIYSYYGQKKYKYKITEKKVIDPDDVSILKRNKNKKELTLMTCWPIGTTLNRLILIGEMVEE